MLCSKCKTKKAKFINAQDWLDGISRSSFCSDCYEPPVYNPRCAVQSCNDKDVHRATVLGRNDFLCKTHAHLGHNVPEA